jgi:hypothetical protein
MPGHLLLAYPLLLLLLQDAARNGKGKLTADVQMYAATAEEVAIAKGVPYVDVYNTIMGVKDWVVSACSTGSSADRRACV